MTRFVLLANPESRRVTGFQAALAAHGLPPARVVAWRGWLRGEAELSGEPGEVLRIESPGEDAAVERELLALGAEVPCPDHPRAERLTAAEARALPPDPGRIRAPRQWFLGFERALARVAVEWTGPALDAPSAIATAFGKGATHAALSAAGLAVPEGLGSVGSYAELRDRMADRGVSRVFVKLEGSSSASGVVALAASGQRVVAYSAADLVREGGEPRLYNVLRVRRRSDAAEVGLLVDLLAREGVHVERWVPKPGLGDGPCDLRLVVIGGRARHAVVRVGRGPLTNLHLGNARGDLAAARAALGPDGWARVQATAEAATAALPGLFSAGVDLVVPGWRRPRVLEVNAFGDLLPGLLDDGGRDTYAATVAAWLERESIGAAAGDPLRPR